MKTYRTSDSNVLIEAETGEKHPFSLETFGISPAPVLMVSCGTQESPKKERIAQLLKAVAARCPGIVVLTGGTPYGVIQLAADAFAAAYKVGVTPEGFLTYQTEKPKNKEAGMTYEGAFQKYILQSQDVEILVAGDTTFGAEVQTIAQCAGVLSSGKPVVVLEICGGGVSMDEMLAVKSKHLFVITGAEPDPTHEVASALRIVAEQKRLPTSQEYVFMEKNPKTGAKLQRIVDEQHPIFCELPLTESECLALADEIGKALGL